MPVFNGEAYLSEAISSILAQTFSDFEFIIIDDGSIDGTPEIINQFTKFDPRIKSFYHKNQGLAFTLNRGLSLANSRWIARIDADDVARPKRLEMQYKEIIKNNLVLLGTGCELIDEQGNLLRKKKYPKLHSSLITQLSRMGSPFPHSSVMFDNNLAKSIGGYSYRFPRAEDRKLWLDLSRMGRIGCLENSLVAIRQHTSQISNDNSGIQQFYDALNVNVNHLFIVNYNQDLSKLLSDEDWSIFTSQIRTQGYDHHLREIYQFKIDYYKNYNSTNFIAKIFNLIFSKHMYKLIYFRIVIRRISQSTFSRLAKIYPHF